MHYSMGVQNIISDLRGDFWKDHGTQTFSEIINCCIPSISVRYKSEFFILGDDLHIYLFNMKY